MNNQQLLKFLNLPAIDKSYFARRFYGTSKKYDPRINNFIMKAKVGNFNESEFNRLREIVTEFSNIEL